MTRRVVKVRRVIYSEVQGKRTGTLEVGHEASPGNASGCIGGSGMVKKPHLKGLTYLQPYLKLCMML